MVFTSYAFLGFLALVFLGYYVIPKKWQGMFLLLASLIFYAFSGITNLAYILAVTLITYFGALQIGKVHETQKAYLKANKETLDKDAKKKYREEKTKLRKRIAALVIILDLGILAVVKYADFAITNINQIIQATGSDGKLSLLGILLPMGISFFTLQAIGYLIDVYRDAYAPEKNFLKFALFITFFPQLVQGPIARCDRLGKTLYAPHAFNGEQFAQGLQRILWGFFKKLVIADRLFGLVGTVTDPKASYGGGAMFLCMIAYTLELYADFTGGIDVTIGTAQALGIELEENFKLPYYSTSIKEYWRRWHITMCGWFRDYLFYPVSTSFFMKAFSKFAKAHLGAKVGKRLPVYVSSFIVWFATGIWHGANWNFVVWGLCNWAVLMISEEFEGAYAKFHEKAAFAESGVYRAFMILRTFLIVCVMNLFDCYATLGQTFKAFGSIFVRQEEKLFADGLIFRIGLSAKDYVIAAVALLIVWIVSLIQRKQEKLGEAGKSVRALIAERPYALRAAIWFLLFVAVLLFGQYGIGYDSSQFIYNRF